MNKKHFVLYYTFLVFILGIPFNNYSNEEKEKIKPNIFEASAKIIKVNMSTLDVEFYWNPMVGLTEKQGAGLTVGELSFEASIEIKDQIELLIAFSKEENLKEKGKEKVDLEHTFTIKLGEEISYSDLIYVDGEKHLWVIIAKVEESLTFSVPPNRKTDDDEERTEEKEKSDLKMWIEWK